VHGCCTNANGVVEVWDALRKEIDKEITNKNEWEVVVWDWHEYTTPTVDYRICLPCFKTDADAAYQSAKQQGAILANAIKIHPYKHVHFIGHSAGSKLIHEAATTYISDYFIRQENPFIHLTFLDAYTPNEWDSNGEGSYGSLPTDYPNHYSEHYVDRGLVLTDACLENAFNFDITNWIPDKDDRSFEFGHQWPHRWYKKSVSFPPVGPLTPGFAYGYRLSLEGSGKDLNELSGLYSLYPKGQQCPLFGDFENCEPAACPSPGGF